MPPIAHLGYTPPRGSLRSNKPAVRSPTGIFPRWISRDPEYNLREVAPRLFVGAEQAPLLAPRIKWTAIVDFYGEGAKPDRCTWYQHSAVLRWPFLDGDNFPVGCLDAVRSFVAGQIRDGPVLIHCQAGLSRSASAAYGLLRTAGLSHEEALRRVYASEPEFPRHATITSAREWARARRQ